MKYIVLALKGVAYGITHIVPGLGGGLILILLGIYEQLVEALGNLFDLRRWREHLAFLAPVAIGMVLGMVVLARVITEIMSRFPAASMFFFMGLLVGTIPSVWRMHDDMRPTVGRVIALGMGLALVIALRAVKPQGGGSLQAISTPLGAAYNLLISFIAGGASVTPGLDGSYMLLLGGTYEPVIEAVADLSRLIIHWLPLITTSVGAVAGILIFSKLIYIALKRVPAVSAYMILGLVVGSVYGLWPKEPARVGAPLLILAFLVGVALAWLSGRSEERHTSPIATKVSGEASKMP
ncbi:MAG: DUF368 domain-containing protein [Chloroflexi bacterium]|nr:DUF368 domain-containing protein [Chloroflexota bacterium]